MSDFSREIGWPLHPNTVGLALQFGLGQGRSAAGDIAASRQGAALMRCAKLDSNGGLGV